MFSPRPCGCADKEITGQPILQRRCGVASRAMFVTTMLVGVTTGGAPPTAQYWGAGKCVVASGQRKHSVNLVGVYVVCVTDYCGVSL